METFRDLRELIRWLGRGQVLLADMFSKRKTKKGAFFYGLKLKEGQDFL